jgi:hypothetical protein
MRSLRRTWPSDHETLLVAGFRGLGDDVEMDVVDNLRE